MAKQTPDPAPRDQVRQIVCTNRKARHLYEILDVWEAGIVLQGTEVKSLRQGHGTMADSYAEVRDGEVFLHHFHINPYEQGNRYNHEPTRTRKLLLRKKEIKKLIGRTVEKGLTLVPLQVYFRNGYVKVEIALARGKKTYDKRRDIADRETQRDMQRGIKERSR